MSRSATLQLVDAGLPTERCVVVEAASEIDVAPELLREWRAGNGKHVTMRGNLVTFGTAGEGCGRLTYEIVFEPDDKDLVSRFDDQRYMAPLRNAIMRFVRDEEA